MADDNRGNADAGRFPGSGDLFANVRALIAPIVESISNSTPSRPIDLEVDAEDGTGAKCRVAFRIGGESLVGASAPSDIPAAQPEFNTEGHHVIALLMERDLRANNPATLDTVNGILTAVDRTIREAATFPDDIRNQQPQTKPFHFVDIPFEDGGPVNPPLPAAPHVLSQIEEFSTFLRSRQGTEQERADALSWLIHLFGDVHQPLHCIDHISDLHPGGDRGGNSFRIRGAKRNLHSLWDSSVNVSQDKDEDTLADEILQAHSRGSLATELGVDNMETWARASFNLAKSKAYSLEENPDNPPTPSAAYKRMMERIGRKQAALAAYRLADRLVAVLQ